MESQLLIDNEARSATNGATFERRHPTTGAVVTRAAAGTVEDALAAVASASTAYQSWRKSAPSERRRILLKAADAFGANLQSVRRAGADAEAPRGSDLRPAPGRPPEPGEGAKRGSPNVCVAQEPRGAGLVA